MVGLGLWFASACDKPESKAEPSSRSREHDVDPAADPPASKPSAAKPEIVSDEVFRPPVGDALVLLPELPEGWSLVHVRRSGIGGIQLFRGTRTNFTGFITLVFFPPITPAPSEAAMLEQFGALMGAGNPHLVATGTPAAFQDPPGLAFTLGGTAESGVVERAWTGVVVDGSAVVGVYVRGETSVFDSELMPMAKTLRAGLRVGKAVPTLPETKPSVALEGVWEHLDGLDLEWISFDPRGYAHTNSPSDPTWLDFDISLALGRGLYHYAIAGDTLVLEPTPADPERVTRRWKFERKPDSIVIEGDDYRRIDGAPVTLAPGSWEYYDSTSSGSAGIAVDEAAYVIAADGTYTHSGGFSFTHTEMDANNPAAIDWSATGYIANPPAKGKWTITGNQLILDDGQTKALRTIYPSKHSTQFVYIGGQKFGKMK